jgi:hypothetical protein
MRVLANAIKADKGPNFELYKSYKSKLERKAANIESTKSLSSIRDANEEFIKILENLKDKGNEYFTSDKINIFNMRISHVILLGVLYDSERLSSYSKYMITAISFALQGSISDIPKYRIDFIRQNTDAVTKCVTAILDGTGAKEFATYIKNIKIEAKDFSLLSENNNVQVKQSSDIKISENGKQLISSGTFGLLGFRWLGEKINLITVWKERQRLSEEEWLKSHVTLLMSKLDSIDENSEEYSKLKKVIERYEDQINKYERKRTKKG